MKSVYIQELDDFYGAVDHLQDGLQQVVKSASAEELRPELAQYLEQMRELGRRLERIFSMVNMISLRIMCNGMNEVGEELHEKVESNYGNEVPNRNPSLV